MKAVTVRLLLIFLVIGKSFGQSGAVIPQGGSGHATEASCVILKRMGPADQVTSHLYSFGIRGKQFQYVEGKLPSGYPFHGRLTDHDVRNLQARGAEVIVLNQNFTADELKQARSDCQGETGKTPNQGEQTELSISSTPSVADIEIDGKFVGSTPSSITLATGDHNIRVSKSGFTVWNKKITTSGGHVNMNAELQELK